MINSRIAVISDLHLTNSLPYTNPIGNERKRLLKKYLKFFFHKLHRLNIKVLVVPGDICHSASLDSEDLELLDFFLGLINFYSIDTIMIDGNHDIDGRRSILGFLEGSSTYKLVNYFSERSFKWSYRDIDFHCINYCSQHEFISSAAMRVLHKDKDKFNILVGHVGVKGSMHGTMKSIVGLKKTDIEELGKEFDLIILGHHHQFQWVTPKCLYVGAPQQTRIDEINTTPGGIIINVPSLKVGVIENKLSPRFSVVEGAGFSHPDIYGKIVKPVFKEDTPEADRVDIIKRIMVYKPYHLIKPRMKERFKVAKDSGSFPKDKRQSLIRTMKSFSEEKKRPRSFYEHTLEIYEKVGEDV